MYMYSYSAITEKEQGELTQYRCILEKGHLLTKSNLRGEFIRKGALIGTAHTK